MARDDKSLSAPSSRTEVDAFLHKLAAAPRPTAAGGRGRLVFAMDATASREASWDQAARLHAAMFKETAAIGGLEIQLAYYRGLGEFEASPWLTEASALLARMSEVFCVGGHTQIEKVLRHTVAETKRAKVNALVFVGDCMEEAVDQLCGVAGELGLLGVPAFLFHEGDDVTAARAFRQLARLTGGACCRFDASSPGQLRDLLSAVAVYAAGGRQALADYSQQHGGAALQITSQMKGAGR